MQQLNPIVSRLLGLSPEVSYEAVDNVKEGTVANNLNVPTKYTTITGNNSMKNMEDFAAKWLHVRELSQNAKFNDDAFGEELAKVGHKKGEPYCAYFAKSAALNSTESQEEKNLVNAVLTPSSVRSFQNAQKRGLVTNTPSPNSIAIYQTGPMKGHTALVTKDLGNGKFETIEGNTTGGGAREGDGVYRRIRNLSAFNNPKFKLLGFIKFGE